MRVEKFEIDTEVFCRETRGAESPEIPCGRLTVVTLRRSSGKLTHLIVDPGDQTGPRLVPAALARTSESGIRLHCARDEFDALPPAVVAHVEPAQAAQAAHVTPSESASATNEERRWRRHDEVSSWPLFGLGPNVPNPTIGAPVPMPVPEPHVEFEDRVPAEEARIHGDERVHASDGDVGHVAGVAVDAGDREITHVLLDEGHLWTHKRVGIPVQLVRRISDEGVSVRLSKRQIKHLPPVGEDLATPHGPARG